MKLFSLWQPWASFMWKGYKLNETRSWSTSYRGLMAIHAAKNKSALPDARSILEAAGLLKDDETTLGGMTWPLGKILCVVDLVDCVPTEQIRDGLSQRERAMGDYSDGRYVWITKTCRQLDPLIPYRGTQGLRPISTEGLTAILRQYPSLTVGVAD